MFKQGYVKCVKPVRFVDGTLHLLNDILFVNNDTIMYYNNEYNRESYVQVYKYFMYDFNENYEIFIGYFENDDEFWTYYKQNQDKILEKQKRITNGEEISWFMYAFKY